MAAGVTQRDPDVWNPFLPIPHYSRASKARTWGQTLLHATESTQTGTKRMKKDKLWGEGFFLNK